MSNSQSKPAKNATFNRNPLGHNGQEGSLPRTPEVEALLRGWAAMNIHNADDLVALLAKEGYTCRPRTVKRVRGTFEIYATGHTLKHMTLEEAEGWVKDAMDKDPSGQKGTGGIYDSIYTDRGKGLPKGFVHRTMKIIDPEGFERRKPGNKIVVRQPITSLGPNEEWSADGHDKLGKIGLLIWAIRDKYSRFWIGLYLVPNNRLKDVVAYLWLKAIQETGGMPLQTTTDCGSETTEVYGLANALREYYSPNIHTDAVPAHRFLKSIHNITIERGWLRLRLTWGDNVLKRFNEFDDWNPTDPKQFLLARWLWSTGARNELAVLRFELNKHVFRTDKRQILPSGTSPYLIYNLPERHGGKDMLQEVNLNVISELMEHLGGEDLMRFVTKGYELKAVAILATLDLTPDDLNTSNAWTTFRAMLPKMPQAEPDEVAFSLSQ